MLAFLLFWVFGFAAAPAAKDRLIVVVSLKPIHGIVSSVMMGVGKPLLLFGSGPPAGKAALDPKQVAMLDQATLLFWVGPNLETALIKPLIERKDRLTEVALLAAPGVRHQEYLTPKQLAAREKKDAPDNSKDKGAGAKAAKDKSAKDKPAKDKPDEDEDENPKRKWLPRDRALTTKDIAVTVPDPRIWLDPRNALALTRHVALVLARIDPERASVYRRNAAALLVRIETMDAQFDEVIRPVKRRAYASLNNSLQHFEAQYDMRPATRLDLKPGDLDRKTILQARATIRDKRVGCLFASSAFDKKRAAAVAAGTYARLVVVDPYGNAETAGRGAYLATMRTLAAEIGGCLENPRGRRRR
jgi:zinc transport system substrate-binding protein